MSKKVSKTAAGLFRILTVYAKLELLFGLALVVGFVGYLVMERQQDKPTANDGASYVQL